MRQHARSRMTGLALIIIDRPGNRFRRRIKIGIGHHNLCALAAKLQRHAFDIAFARIAHHQLADFG